jgi:hypothetical protein
MSVNPEAVGSPPDDADQYLKNANAEDPRSDPRAPAREPGGPDSSEKDPQPDPS